MNGKACADDELSSAKRSVVEARRMVERQRQLIDALRVNRCDTEDAERTLRAFLQALTALEALLQRLSKSAQ
jgi:hypothetical protein